MRADDVIIHVDTNQFTIEARCERCGAVIRDLRVYEIMPALGQHLMEH